MVIRRKTSVLTLLACLMSMFAIGACQEQGAADSEYVNQVELRVNDMEDTIIMLRERADNPATPNPDKFRAQIDSLSVLQQRIDKTLTDLKEQNPDVEKFKAELEPMLKRWDKEYETARDW